MPSENSRSCEVKKAPEESGAFFLAPSSDIYLSGVANYLVATMKSRLKGSTVLPSTRWG